MVKGKKKTATVASMPLSYTAYLGFVATYKDKHMINTEHLHKTNIPNIKQEYAIVTVNKWSKVRIFIKIDINIYEILIQCSLYRQNTSVINYTFISMHDNPSRY